VEFFSEISWILEVEKVNADALEPFTVNFHKTANYVIL
jgi:hypothetical protein